LQIFQLFKDWTDNYKDKDKVRAFKDQEWTRTCKVKNKDKDLKLVLKESLRTTTRTKD